MTDNASAAEARAFLSAIRVFLSMSPRQEDILVFVAGILQEASGLLTFEEGEIFPNPNLVGEGSEHGIAALPLRIKISTL
jgi:hypothetical protein